ncbi:LutC/YkgG family protein [Cellulomonas marina]|uniref:L-lactate dehydrogenase complex protein LldG n=1 Tax=Cellulomonas marina TaxID=988821 RepID=A0A1I1AHA8_9CELL|nr:LUD domain-containing protein [Cellulomonas marina]GIG29727.1 hypothetical protein Cma02nite_23270 [Cellulomonas marina]SFB35868.1 L-lactate dehydrogenase complex protein LldG [Cellulomonas marina]
MSARTEVLARVRRALAPAPGRSAAPVPTVPRDYRRHGDVATGSSEAVELLVDRLVDYRATVVRTSTAGLAAAVAAQLEGVPRVVVPPGLDPAWVAAAREAVGEVLVDGVAPVGDPTGDATGDATGDPMAVPGASVAPLSHAALDATAAVVTACRVAVAETGTIVLDGEGDQGRRVLTLLPDRHVCVVRADQVVGSVPEAVALLATHPERPMTWISGPSATSDIELVRVEGVHGPRDLRVLVVED